MVVLEVQEDLALPDYPKMGNGSAAALRLIFQEEKAAADMAVAAVLDGLH